MSGRASRRALPSVHIAALRKSEWFLPKATAQPRRHRLKLRERCFRRRNRRLLAGLDHGRHAAIRRSPAQFAGTWRGKVRCCAASARRFFPPFPSCRSAAVCGCWEPERFRVTLYQKQVPGTLITPGMGMRVGALAGVFGFLVNAVVTTVSFVAFRSTGDFRHAMQEQMDKQLASNPDPKVKEMMQQMFDWMSTPQGAATMMVLVLVVLAVRVSLFTAAGGALGASIVGPAARISVITGRCAMRSHRGPPHLLTGLAHFV